MRFNLVQLREGRIVHQGRMDGVLSAGETVQMQIKWGHRHNGMRVHSAGHALHDAVMTLKPEGIIPIKAMHGHDAFVEYSGDWLEANPREIEDGVNALVHANLPVAMRATTLAEIEANCRFVPHGLPRNKPLRVVQIGDGQAVPCGGVHVRELGEIGKVIVVDVCRNRDTANLRIRYRVTKGDA